METLFLKSIFEDGIVYFKINLIENPDDDYIYVGEEIIQEEGNHWEIDEYELTEEDLQEMYEDGFCEIEGTEFSTAMEEAKKHVRK